VRAERSRGTSSRELTPPGGEEEEPERGAEEEEEPERGAEEEEEPERVAACLLLAITSLK